MTKQTVPFVAATAALVFMGAGCNPVASVQQKVGQVVTEGIVNQATGGKVKLDENNNTVSFTDDQNGGSVAFGDNVSIPKDFPKDAPIYPGAKAMGVVMSRSGDNSSSATLKSNDDVKTVIAWYATKLGSWKQDASFSSDGTEIRSYSNAGAKFALTVAPGDNNSGSTLSLVYTPAATSTGSN
jgi:hypothetical protein